MIERHRVVWLLLDDALARAAASADLRVRTLVDRLHLLEGDARERQQCWSAPAPDAVLLDPMFPERDGSAAVRKAWPVYRQCIENFFTSALNAQEIKQLSEILPKLRAHLPGNFMAQACSE